MKHVIKLVFGMLLVLLSINSMANERLVMIEGSFELEPSVYFLGGNLTGAVHGKECKTCPLVKLTITPETKAFNGRKEVSLSSKVGSSTKPTFTYYNLKSKKVTRLVWWY